MIEIRIPKTEPNMLRSFQSLGFGVSTFNNWRPQPQTLPLVSSLVSRRSLLFNQIKYCFRSFHMSAIRSESNPDANLSSSSSSSSSTLLPTKARKPKTSFCPSCGGPTKQVIPEGEEKIRDVCTLCGGIYYENPKMVVGCLVEHNNKVLLCKRKIQPSYGLWTLPAGYMEIGESAAEGATRETLEEACAEVEVLSPFAQLDIPRIGQYRVT
eukprot:TRINITY_DN5260_c0_g1_i1.p1 TRINITY_DN5260_c0_g1~~TRINITY_DN5260_c0_g1_i1.p1  ORF type:complete len:211 (-),score=41.39 TRINITY_DN5260_c0_g1_i1:516-1148(-)